MMNPLQIPDQELVSIHRYAGLRDIIVTGGGWEELSEVNQHVMLRRASEGLGPPVARHVSLRWPRLCRLWKWACFRMRLMCR